MAVRRIPHRNTFCDILNALCFCRQHSFLGCLLSSNYFITRKMKHINSPHNRFVQKK